MCSRALVILAAQDIKRKARTAFVFGGHKEPGRLLSVKGYTTGL